MPLRWPTNTDPVVSGDFGPGYGALRYVDSDPPGKPLRCYKTTFPGAEGTAIWHDGQDTRAALLTPLVAVEAGVVTAHPTWDGGIYGINYGIVVRIDGTTSEFAFWHCTPGTFVAIGQHVNKGDVIAKSGKSGASVAHCHFGLMFLESGLKIRYNPERFMPAHRIKNYSTGGLDPVPAGDMVNDLRVVPTYGFVTPTVAVARVRAAPAVGTTPILGSLASGAKLPFIASVVGAPVNGNAAWNEVKYGAVRGYLSATVSKKA